MNEKLRQKEIIKTSFIGIIGNIVLVGFKAFVGILAASISIIMDAINNLTDALSSIITIIGTKLSNKKANKKHPFGYGRIEYITSTLIAILILFAGSMAIYESIKSIIDHFKNGTMPSFEVYSIIIIAAAIFFKASIGLFFKHKGKKVNSDALNASGTDALFDCILSLSTLIGAIVAKYAGIYIEGYLGIVIGLFILRSGFEVLKESLALMIGNRYDSEVIKAIKEDIGSVDGVLGVYDLILNNYGHNKNIASVHIGVKDCLKAKDIQKIERDITSLMYEKYHIVITVGIYAENFEDQESKDAYQKVLDIIKEYPQVLQIHGFYLDKEHKIINYDLVISFDDDNPDETIKEISKKTSDVVDGYFVYIAFDQDFSLT